MASNEQAARKLEERWMFQAEVRDYRNWLIREVLSLQSQLETSEEQNKLLKDAPIDALDWERLVFGASYDDMPGWTKNANTVLASIPGSKEDTKW